MTAYTMTLGAGDTLTVTATGGGTVPPPVITPPPVTEPPPVVGAPEIIPYGGVSGISITPWFAPGVVYAIEMDMPPGPYSSQDYIYGGIAQVPSGAVPMLGKFSQTAGDLANAPQNPNPSFTQQVQPGSRWYLNVSLLADWPQNEQVRFSAFYPR